MLSFRRFLELNVNYYLRGRVPTLVYSMQRSGSIALFRSLCEHGDFAIGLHQMNPNLHQSGSTKWAFRHLIRDPKPVKIISLVRNPIESILSIYARTAFSKDSAKPQIADSSAAQPTADDYSLRFKTGFLEKQRHRYPLEWFESEFKTTLGIDAYDTPFDKGKGCVQIQKGPFEVLIIRTELDDAKKAHIVSEFLDMPEFKMLKAGENVKIGNDMAPGMPGELTKHGSKYKSLKQQVTFPDVYLDEIIGSRFVQHFFTQEECDAMRARFSSQ